MALEDVSQLAQDHVSRAKSKVTSWNYDAGQNAAEKWRALEVWEGELRRIIGLDTASH